MKTSKFIHYEIIGPLFGLFAFVINSDFNADYINYLNKFLNISSDNFSLYSMEVGFQFLSIFVKKIGFSFEVYMYLLISISLSLKLYYVRKFIGTKVVLFLLFYSSSFLLLHELIQIRLAVAIALLYAIFYYIIKESEKIKTVLLAIVAISIHVSIVLFVASLLIFKYPKIFIFLAGCAIVLTLQLDFALDSAIYFESGSKINGYLYELNTGAMKLKYFPFQMLYLLLIYILSIVARLVQKQHNVESEILRYTEKLFLISVIAYWLTAISPVVAFRLLELINSFLPLSQTIIIFILLKKKFIKSSIALIVMFTVLNLIIFARGILPLVEGIKNIL